MNAPIRTAAVLGALALAAATLSAAGSSASAASHDAAFRPLNGFTPTGPEVRVDPRHYSAVTLDAGAIRTQLSSAPKLGASASAVLRVPAPSGGSERFAVQRTRLMQARLAAAHPEIQTWSGVSLDHPGTTVALDVTPMGFHASVRGPTARAPGTSTRPTTNAARRSTSPTTAATCPRTPAPRSSARSPR